MALADSVPLTQSRWPVDRLGLVVAVLAVAGALTPFVTFRPNRIIAGKGALER